MSMRRRQLLAMSAATALAAACRSVVLPSASPAPVDELDAISSQILSGGPPPDGIPPIEEPKYVPIAEARKTWTDDAIVDALLIDGRPRVYPRMITVWHEIVNEKGGGRPIAITFCPLTGSTVVFSGVLPDGSETTFGTSGQLYNSNLVMYDRATQSMWPQLFGTAVRGERKGQRLAELPGAVTTTLGRWAGKHPDSLVLSTDTGHVRQYGVSPYGSYDRDEGTIFPVTARDARYHDKRVVVGVRWNGAAIAIPKSEFAARGEAAFHLGGRELVARYDRDLDAVRVLDRRTLEPLSAYDVMWFAWFAFNPSTAVLA